MCDFQEEDTMSTDQTKHRVHIVVPFGTGPDLPSPADTEDGDMFKDEDLARTDTEIAGLYPVSDIEEAYKLLAAAEALGFACSYDNPAPRDDEAYVYVTITFRGIME